MGYNSAFKGLKLLKSPGNGRLNNLNDPVLNVLRVAKCVGHYILFSREHQHIFEGVLTYPPMEYLLLYSNYHFTKGKSTARPIQNNLQNLLGNRRLPSQDEDGTANVILLYCWV